jgi:hypothetical protein
MAIANRGLCHFYSERLEPATDDLTAAIDHGVASEQILSTRATAYQLMGKDDLAAADRRRALLLNPRAIVQVFPYALPLELVAHVLSFLSPREKARCALTCHLWHDLLNTPEAPASLWNHNYSSSAYDLGLWDL